MNDNRTPVQIAVDNIFNNQAALTHAVNSGNKEYFAQLMGPVFDVIIAERDQARADMLAKAQELTDARRALEMIAANYRDLVVTAPASQREMFENGLGRRVN